MYKWKKGFLLGEGRMVDRTVRGPGNTSIRELITEFVVDFVSTGVGRIKKGVVFLSQAP